MKSASVVFVTADNLIGLGLRGSGLESPLTWAAIGGHQDDYETLHQTAHREVWEELGIRVPNRLEYLGHVGENYVFVCRVPDTFSVRLNWENLDFQWKTLSEWQNHKLHPELRQVIHSRTFLAEQEFEAMPEETEGYYGFPNEKGEFADTEKWLKENYFPKDPDSYYDYEPQTREVELPRGGTKNFPINWWFISQTFEFWETILGIPFTGKTPKVKQKKRVRGSHETFNPFAPQAKKQRTSDYLDEIMRQRQQRLYDDLREWEK
jgi:hypothetical protein